MTEYTNYPKIKTLGDRDNKGLLNSPVYIEEKLDGSQFSFGSFLNEEGKHTVRCWSRRHEVTGTKTGMFAVAVAEVEARWERMASGCIYRAEYLQRPRHNVLTYERVPEGHLALFDVVYPSGEYLPLEDVDREAECLGIGRAPVLCVCPAGSPPTMEGLEQLTEGQSCLGGPMEGVVIKEHTASPSRMVGKHVRPAFKEVMHKGGVKKHQAPTIQDELAAIIEEHTTEARWQKALQRATEDEALSGTAHDIGLLVKAVQADVQEECATSIQARLYAFAEKPILKGVVQGLAQWYKAKLAESAFTPPPSRRAGNE